MDFSAMPHAVTRMTMAALGAAYSIIASHHILLLVVRAVMTV